MQTESEQQNHRGGPFRSKRSQYAARACKECRRRKVKCDGQDPCSRCSGQLMPCVFVNDAHAKADGAFIGLRAGKQDINIRHHGNSAREASSHEDTSTPSTYSRKRSHSNGEPPITTQQSQPAPNMMSLEFCGPSSTEFAFNAVNGNLQAMGIGPAILEKGTTSSVKKTLFSRLTQYGPFMKVLTMDPMWDVKKETAIALIDDWCYGLGMIFPIVSRQILIETANHVCDCLSSAVLEDLNERGEMAVEALFNQNTNKLKIVLAIGLTKEAGGRNQQAERLFQSISEAVEGLIWNSQGYHGIQLLFLVAMYHYHLFEEFRTGRSIAFAARLCLEMGLHRRAMLTKIAPDKEEQSEVLKAFWAVYMLERRLSLGQGIPFSIQDSYIDPSLFEIAKTDAALSSMLEWTRIAGRMWYVLNSQGEKTLETRADERDELDNQVLEWYDSLAERFKLDMAILTNPMVHSDTMYYRSVFFARKAHLRNLIYRSVLHSSLRFSENEQLFAKAINVAKETIRMLRDLNESTRLVTTHPLFFQQLLLTAFGNLLLAVVNTPVVVWNSLKEEFDTALNLFSFLSSRCTALRRTWQRLQGLRDLPAKLAHFSNKPAQPVFTAEPASMQVPPSSSSAAVGSLSFDDIFPDSTHPIPNWADLFAPERFMPAEDDTLQFTTLFDFPFTTFELSHY